MKKSPKKLSPDEKKRQKEVHETLASLAKNFREKPSGVDDVSDLLETFSGQLDAEKRDDMRQRIQNLLENKELDPSYIIQELSSDLNREQLTELLEGLNAMEKTSELPSGIFGLPEVDDEAASN